MVNFIKIKMLAHSLIKNKKVYLQIFFLNDVLKDWFLQSEIPWNLFEKSKHMSGAPGLNIVPISKL